MKEKIVFIFTVVFALGFVGITLYSAFSFNHRLSRTEEQIRWMDDNFTVVVPDYFDSIHSTTEHFMDMKEVNLRLERLEK